MTRRCLRLIIGCTIITILGGLFCCSNIGYRIYKRQVKISPADPVVVDQFPLVEQWRLETGGKVVSTPAVRDDWVAIWTTEGLVVANGLTGEEKWQYNVAISGLTMPPVMVESYVLAPHGEFVDILSIETGQLLAQLETLACCELGATSIAVGNDHVYIVWGSESLAAYSLSTREMMWQLAPLGTRAPPDVVVCGEHTLCLVMHNFVQVYDALSGSELGRIEVGKEDTTLGYPIYDGKATLYAVNGSIRGDTLVRLSPITSIQNWSLPVPEMNDSPSLYNDTMYVAGVMPAKVMAIDTSTRYVLWESVIDDGSFQTPVEFCGAVYVRCTSGRIYALDANNGQTLGCLQTRAYGIFGVIGTDHPIALRPVAIDDQVLVVPSGNGLYGYAVPQP